MNIAHINQFKHSGPIVITSHSGFTLLELIISIALTAILMTVLVVGLNLIARDWEKHGEHLDQKLDESLLLLQIEKAILGTYAYQYKDNNIAQEKLLFSGNENKILWVSTVSPNRSSGLSLWQLTINKQYGLQLKVRPVLSAELQHEKSSDYFTDYKISLHYLSEDSANKKQWFDSWIDKDEGKLPLGIRIDFKVKDGLQLGNNTNQDFSIFALIRVSSGTSVNTGGGAGVVRSGSGKKLFDVIQSGGKSGSSSAEGLFK